MTNQKQDRRSQRTREALFNSLISLLLEKHYDEITVNEIIERANIGRSTFYVHYQTKDDLLKSGFERVLDRLIENIQLVDNGQDLHIETSDLFRHAKGHYELYRTLVWGSGFSLLTIEGHSALSKKLQDYLSVFIKGKIEPAIPLPVLCHSIAGTILMLLKWWLDNKMPYSPERMDEIFHQLAMPGVRSILKFA